MPSTLISTVGREWRATVVHTELWKATTEERPGGESEGFFVSWCDLRAYLKPSKPQASVAELPRTAHEKIAADLAFDLALPVPPAVLVDGTSCGGKVRAAVVSLVLYPEVQKWSHATATTAASAIAHHIMRSTRTMWSGMLAFDTWIANADRDNQTNLLIGTATNLALPVSEPVFCDFSYSMLFSGWGQGGQHTVTLVPCLPVLKDLFDRDAALETAEKIRDFPIETIVNVVNRIPEEYLQAAQKPIIIDGLSERRKAIPGVIAAT